MDLKKGISNFSLVGFAKVTDTTFKLNNENEKKTWISNSMYLGLDCGDGNIVYSSLTGGFNPDGTSKIYAVSIGENGKADYKNRTEIIWEDRFDEEIISNVANTNFITISLGDETKKFLSEYDAVEYLSNNLKDGTKLSINGKTEFNMYNGEISVQRKITSIYIAKETTKEKAHFDQMVLCDKNSIGKFNKDTNCFSIFGYVIEYLGKVNNVKIGKNIAIPYEFTYKIPVTVTSESAEKVKKGISSLLLPKKGEVKSIEFGGNIISSVTTGNITKADLSEEMQNYIDLGIITEEDAIKGVVIKNNKRQEELRLNQIRQEVNEDGGIITKITDNYCKSLDLIDYETAVNNADSSDGSPSNQVEKATVEDGFVELDDDFMNNLFGAIGDEK